MSHTNLRWVGHLLTYVKNCERGRVKLKDFEQQLCVYNAFFPMDPDNCDIMESQCINIK